MAEKALTLNPTMADALALRGTLYLLKSETEVTAKEHTAALRQAADSLREALSLNPLLALDFGTYLEQATR